MPLLSRILIVAATHAEIAPLAARLPRPVPTLVTGVGPAATGYALGRALALESYRLVINIGLAGAFRTDWPLGTVVEVSEDRFADLGAEDREGFLDLQQLGLITPDTEPYEEGMLRPLHGIRPACLAELPQASGITVHTAHGSRASIDAVTRRLAPDVESMEGAAFFYACRMAGVPCVQLRAISNHVVPRDRDAWNIPLAVANLCGFSQRLIEELQSMSVGT